MTALNKKGTQKFVKGARIGVSYNGNPQPVKDDAQQLYELIVLSLYGKDSYYETTDQRVQRLEALVNSVVSNNQLDFIANAIVHARHVMNIRSMPVVLAVYFAKALRDQNKQYPHLREVVRDVIGRADQITDLYAVALGVFGSKKAVPMAIKRGVADAFEKFNEYQFAKYNSSGAVKLRDVLRIVHPVGKSAEQGELYQKIMKDALEVPYTWETELSKNGQLPEGERKAKDVLWTDLIRSGKLGYMALLRNLRNIVEASVTPQVITEVANRIGDPAEVAKSKQLPFRFTNALNSIAGFGNNKLNAALSKAVDASLGNLPQLGNGVWIIVDCSGSMSGGFSSRSVGMTPIKTASIFAAALAKANRNADSVKITMFSDDAFHVPVNTEDSVLSITETLMSRVTGGGTNLGAALAKKKDLGFEPDTVIVLSDMQVSYLHKHTLERLFSKDTLKIALNLETYDSTPVHQDDGWYQLGGFSERLFDFIPALRNGDTVVKMLSTSYKGVGGIKKLHVDNDE